MTQIATSRAMRRWIAALANTKGPIVNVPKATAHALKRRGLVEVALGIDFAAKNSPTVHAWRLTRKGREYYRQELI